jgi:hypothetical protein
MSEVFDRFARKMVDGSSRRDALKTLGGFLAGTFLFGLAGRARASGDNTLICERYCVRCICVSSALYDKCVEACELKLETKSPQGLCGRCTPATPFTYCSGGSTCCSNRSGYYCPDPQSDAKNCGACGHVCTGVKPACCKGSCADLASNPSNCGSCGNACPQATPNCVSGKCTAA